MRALRMLLPRPSSSRPARMVVCAAAFVPMPSSTSNVAAMRRIASSACGFETHDTRAGTCVERNVDETVGSLSDVAHTPLTLVDSRRRCHAPSVHRQTHDLLTNETAREYVPAPLRKTVACVDHQTRCADRRNPVMHRLLHPRPDRIFVNDAATVIHAHADDGPAV